MPAEARFAEILDRFVKEAHIYTDEDALTDMVEAMNKNSATSRDDRLHALWSAIFDSVLALPEDSLRFGNLGGLLYTARRRFPSEVKLSPSQLVRWL